MKGFHNGILPIISFQRVFNKLKSICSTRNDVLNFFLPKSQLQVSKMAEARLTERGLHEQYRFSFDAAACRV